MPKQDGGAEKDGTVPFESTIAERLGRLSPASDNFRMTEYARDFCAGLLTSAVFFHQPVRRGRSGPLQN